MNKTFCRQTFGSLVKQLEFLRCSRSFNASSRLRKYRVLYCGSDEFSAVSLRRLHEQHEQDGQKLIESLEIVCRAGKPSGRGLKRLRDVPIKATATALGLNYNEIPTFTGWKPTSDYNLVIAVSFGLKIPPRILNAAEYGGLNLHPSLLPDLRGPAPLHHALLEGRRETGVTLQTLHPEQFDKGAIVAQKPFDIPNDGECTFSQLHQHSAEVAADLLIESLLTCDITKGRPQSSARDAALRHAPKITPEDSHVDWQSWTVERILRTQRALGHVWSHYPLRDGRSVRVQWHGLILSESSPRLEEQASAGRPFVVKDAAASSTLTSSRAVIPTCDGHYLDIETVTIEGRPKHEASAKAVELLLDGRV